MNGKETSGESFIQSLKERAKELDCLYQVDELLNNERLSLSEVFQGIVNVLPGGWQYPEACEASMSYENQAYQTPGFCPAPICDSCSIKVDSKLVGKLEVVYTSVVPEGEEGFFLEKERKLIRTIADRIGQTILQRRMKQVLRAWDTEPLRSDQSKEWMVIVDLLLRTDPDMLFHVCRKMTYHLYFSGVKDAEEILRVLSPDSKESYNPGEINFPSTKLPLVNLASISEMTFKVASHHLSNDEISIRLKNWIQEQKAYHLIKTVDRIGVTVGEIIEAITRYRNIAGECTRLNTPTERWLEVALIRRFLSDNLNVIDIAKQYVEINDFYEVTKRFIFPAESTGKIGGKGTGLFLSYNILRKECEKSPLLGCVKVPKTWCITTDESTDFLHYNNLEELNEQKYKDLSEIRMDYPNIIRMMKNAKFPPGIVKSLAMALDDFGDCPLIVRSSSLLEDQVGSAFSGKYKSLFLANQGDKKQRLEALMDAIVEVYASMYSPDSIKYRSERGLIDFHEEMGILIQEVVGTRIGPYYLPHFAGVAFSNNEFRWSPRIQREDGLIRLVMGLGTRAVDRLSDDFPVLVSPGQPGLRVNIVPDEILHYSPKKVDVINLENNTFETVEIETLIKEFGYQIPRLHQIVSVHQDDYVTKTSAFGIDYESDNLVVTFEGLITDTHFVKKVGLILKTLEDKLGTPVDIEFASDGNDFYILQCRPQSFGVDSVPAPIPKDIPEKDIVFSANLFISNGVIRDITHIVYVDPNKYSQLRELESLASVGRAVGLLNSLLPRRRFILMGPGRWGSRGDIKMGVQVSYADINNTAALIEIARQKSNYLPELSFGTHFFQDLVESNIRYLPLYPDNKGVIFNEKFLTRSKNMLTTILPDFSELDEVIRVIDVTDVSGGYMLHVTMNADLREALGYLARFSGQPEPIPNKALIVEKYAKREGTYDDSFWRWRFYMAERLSERLDFDRFGVRGLYLIGSTNNGTAGPGSDIDLLVYFTGSEEQRVELLHWFTGWSQSLAEMNYLKTGYSTDGLLDIHFVTDEDISKRSSYAVKIGAVTDPAYPLKVST
ncbi:MAG: PEP/pyruvate-binding domain-containing protein [Chitinophagales bacterium]